MDNLEVPGKFLVWLGIVAYLIIILVTCIYTVTTGKIEANTESLENNIIFSRIMFFVILLTIIIGFVLKYYNSIATMETKEQEESNVNEGLIGIPLGITFLFIVFWVRFFLKYIEHKTFFDINVMNILTIGLFLILGLSAVFTNSSDDPNYIQNGKYTMYTLTALIALISTQFHDSLSLFIMLGAFVSLPLIK